MKPDGIARTAFFSDDRRYRYALTRTWDATNPRHFVLIGLNPSVADSEHDDPTVRRCIDFAQREKCGRLVIVNLFAMVATKPHDLLNAPDRLGAENDLYLRHHVADPDQKIIVAAWGVNGSRWPSRIETVIESLPLSTQCFGILADGSPRHPLYLPRDAQLVNFAGALQKLRELRARPSSTPR